jgi:dTDP-4-amino-4,6-dideoxygalactose transaminase
MTDKGAKNPTPNGWLETGDNRVVLFHPYVPEGTGEEVAEVLKTRWIGQGPRVDQFEKEFGDFLGGVSSLAVGSGTDALHLAYLLAGIEAGDEVITPVFTCTATNLPLLYIGAIPVFADIDPKTMNISPSSIREKITPRTKAIATVDYGGLPCDYEEISKIAQEFNLKIIDDAAHAVGAKYRGENIGQIADFTTYSFQAIKHITTADGGLLAIKDPSLLEKGKRLRWFGIDRVAKQGGIWSNDITELGYKYQMTDIGATMGLAGLHKIDHILEHRRNILDIYMTELKGIDGLYNVGSQSLADREHAAWLHTILVEKRDQLQAKLLSNGIESAPVHYRNDMYSILGGRSSEFPNMDSLEDKYLVLPLHMHMSAEDAQRICSIIKSGW